MSKITVAFKKLLGNGRAWRTPSGFTSEFLEILASPIEDIKKRLSSLKYVHFSTFLIDKNNIENGEELFKVQSTNKQSLEERAANIEAQWSLLNGSLNWKPLEDALKKASLNVTVSENLPVKPVYANSIALYGSYQYNEKLKKTDDFIRYGENSNRLIGNGNLYIEGQKYDPCTLNTKGSAQYGSFYYRGYNSEIESIVQYGIRGGSNSCLFITSNEPLTSEQYELLTKIVLQKKPAQTIAICNIQILK